MVVPGFVSFFESSVSSWGTTVWRMILERINENEWKKTL